jgi:hypothetical protein
MFHPVWQTRMVNKDGSIKSRMDWKIATKLENDGIIKLLRGVTDIAKVADGFGAFANGAKWGRDMTVEAYNELIAPPSGPGDTGFYPSPAQLEAAAQKAMDAPKEAGSELHDLFDSIRKGKVQPDADQDRFYQVCLASLREAGYTDMDVIETEVQFADARLGFGGTCDLNWVNLPRGLDWKTVKDFRDPRPSELLQLGAYGMHFGWKQAHIVYIRQSDYAYKVRRLEEDDLNNAYVAFDLALSLSKSIEELEG